jgi:type IV secretory pathway TraG/TraD family ATPase VirD4
MIEGKMARAFEGFEIKYNRFRMSIKMYTLIFTFLLIIYTVLSGVSACVSYKANGLSFELIFAYYKSVLANSLGLTKMLVGFHFDGEHFVRYASEVAHDPFFKEYSSLFINLVSKPFLFWAWLFLLFPLALYFFKQSAAEIKGERHVRGGKLVTAKEIKKKVKDGDLPFGDVKMPRDAETTHTFIMGRPGTGKTVLLSEIVKRVRERGERAIIYDPKGDYTRKFYDPEKGDVIFNPFDARSCNWNLFNEIKKPTDFEAIGYSLIAKNESDKDPFWTDGAREIFRCILKYLYKTGKRDYKNLWTFVTMDSVNLARIFSSSDEYATALQVLADPKQRQAGSLMSTLINYVTAIEYMTVKTDGADFSLENWLDNGKGFIFVTSKKEVADALKPILTLFIDLLAARFLSLDDNDPKRRLHFFLDEFGTLK